MKKQSEPREPNVKGETEEISCNRQTHLIKSNGVYASKAPCISRTIVLERVLPSQPASQLERAFV